MPIVQQLRLEFASEKVCTRCGKLQPLTEYHKQAKKPDGHKSYCKTCCREIGVERYANTPAEQHQAKARAYYAAHKDRIKANALRNYYADTERHKRRILRWNQTHREQRRVYNMRTRHRNPDMHREVWRRRHARKMATQVVRITPAQLAAKCAYWGNRCWICGGPQEAMDHVKPLNKGGAHILCNLRPICRTCNTRKLDKWPYP